MAQQFLEWQQIGKWFDPSEVGKNNLTNNSGLSLSSTPWTHDAENQADVPILMLTAYQQQRLSNNATPEIKKEGNIIYFRNNFDSYVDDPTYRSTCGYAGVRIGIDPNRSIAYPYPYYLTFKARINNPKKDPTTGLSATSYQPNPTPNSITGYESAFHVINICNIDKKIINGRYQLCFNSTGTLGLTKTTPVNNTTEIEYPLSESILQGDWFTVEVLWSEAKETVRINGYSIGSDSNTVSTLKDINTPIFIATAYDWNSESPHFDIADIEIKRIYERSVVPPTLKIEKQDNGDGTVTLTAQGYTDIIPDGVQGS